MNKIILGKILFVLLLISPFLSNGQIYVNVNAMGANDGSSWENAYTDLQDAIQNSAIDDQIWIAAGLYFPSVTGDQDASFSILNSLSLYGGFNGTETSINQRDLANNETILSGDYNQNDFVQVSSNPLQINYTNINENAQRVLIGSNVSGVIVIDGLIIEGGGNGTTGGGALFTPDGVLELNITNCTFMNNSTSDSAGALRFGSGNQETLNCVVRNTTFIRNKCASVNGKGGAIWSTGPGISNIDYINTIFQDNLCNGRGGAITHDLAARPNYTNCVFNNNRSTQGGAVNENSVSDVFFNNCVFYKNSASGQGGSTISNFGDFGDFSVLLFNTIFFENDINPFYGVFGNAFQVANCILEPDDFQDIISAAIGSQDLGANQFAVDPLFVDADDDNFNLQENSTAINAGNFLFNNEPTDLTGYIARVVDDAIDIGPLEYHIPMSAEIANETVACFGASNGVVTVEADNAYPSLIYNWESEDNIGTSLDGLAPGVYDLTVTNAIGDFVVLDFFIADNPEITATSMATPEINNNANGTASVEAAGGTAPYSFEWNTMPVQSTPTATGLTDGTYTVTITDNNNCSLEVEVVVEQTTSILSIDEDSEIKIQPTLFRDNFQINLPTNQYSEQGLSQLSIYTATGQLVLSNKALQPGNNLMEMSQFPQGVYFLVLEIEGKNYRKKVIKQ